MTAGHHRLLLAPWLLLPACTGFGQLPGPLAEHLAQQARTAADQPHVHTPFTEHAEVTLESPHLNGQFQGVLAVRPGPHLALRLQLFPDLGGKVLDIAADRYQLVARQPQTGELLMRSLDEDCTLPYEPLLFIAASLLELFEPVTLERVVAARPVQGGHELLLRPVVVGTHVVATVDTTGRVLHHELRLRAAGWQLVASEDTVTANGPHFTLRAVRTGRELDPDPAAFQVPVTDR